MGCLQSKAKEKIDPVKNDVQCDKTPEIVPLKKAKKPTRSSRISVAIKVGTGIRKSKVHATNRRIVCVFGK